MRRGASGRFVSTSGLQRLRPPEGSAYEIYVVTASYEPITALMEWHRLCKRPGPNRTRDTYLGMLMPVMGHLQKNNLAWNSEPGAVRQYLKDFLIDRVGCQVEPGEELEGYRVAVTEVSPLSQSGLGVLLAALGSFYRIMRANKYYAYHNPMTSELLESLRREHLKQVENVGAPDHAGIRGESWEESMLYPIAFFRHQSRAEWVPAIALEPYETRQRMWAALEFMIRHAPSQRDKVVLLLLKHTGGRLHEVLGLSAGGYRKAIDPCSAFTVRKGSRGCEDKRVYFSDRVEAELSEYVAGERSKLDGSGRKAISQLGDKERIFITPKREAYQDSAFRYHWNRNMGAAAKRFGVRFTPHAVRHLFVTEFMKWIREEEAPNDPERQRFLLRGLQTIMGWRNGRTIVIYNHTFAMQDAVRVVHAFQQRIELPFTASGAPLMQEVAASAGLITVTVPEDFGATARTKFTALWEGIE